jgi:hypothetical protein
MSKDLFMARYGNADDITRLIHTKKFDSVQMVHVMGNKAFNKRHLSALVDLEPLNRHVPHDPMLVAVAQHPLTHKSQLERLVDPHRGYPFTGTQPHRWPDHAKIAQQRLDTWHLDHDED